MGTPRKSVDPVDLKRFQLSKSFRYRNEIVCLYIDGEYQVFAEGRVSPWPGGGEDISWITVSEPVRIGNAPLGQHNRT